MILRKPYAFLIKHFRLLHVIVVFFMAYLIYKTNFLLKFYNDYISLSGLMELQDFSGQLYSVLMFVFPFLIIIFLTILLSVMFVKKKPYAFYLVNVLIMIILLVIYTISYSNINILEVEIMETKTVRLVRDFIFLIYSLQIVSIFLFIIRATGFDLKKFDFGQDLEQLEIDEVDNEEFEVELSLDTAQVKRGFKRNVRYIKYIYVENKFIINMVSLIAISITVFIVYFNINIYSKTYNQKQTFMATDFTMAVNKTYLTNKNYNNKNLTEDKTVVVVELNIRRNYVAERFLVTANIPLVIDNHKFYHTTKYRDKIFDLGYTYEKKAIDRKFEKMLLVYEIPKYLEKSDMKVMYIDQIDITKTGLSPKYVTIKTNPINIDGKQTETTLMLNKKYDLSKLYFENSKIEISSLKIEPYFLEKYSFCYNQKKCSDAYEYIKPNINTNYDKGLLKLVGNVTDPYVVQNTYDFIKTFGYLTYQNKSYKLQTKVSPKMIKEKNAYYLEIPKEVLQYEDIYLNFKIRNVVYKYKI